MNKKYEIFEDQSHDRFVFIKLENNEVVGLNFHQGISGGIMPNFLKSCIHLTEIFRRLKDSQKGLTREGLINKAIELYTSAFIFQTK